MSAHCCPAQLSQLAACRLSTHLTPISRVWLHEMLGPQAPWSHKRHRVARYDQLPPAALTAQLTAAGCVSVMSSAIRRRRSGRRPCTRRWHGSGQRSAMPRRSPSGGAGSHAFAARSDLPSDRQQEGTLLSLTSPECYLGIALVVSSARQAETHLLRAAAHCALHQAPSHQPHVALLQTQMRYQSARMSPLLSAARSPPVQLCRNCRHAGLYMLR